jgi:hypothetical protein
MAMRWWVVLLLGAAWVAASAQVTPAITADDLDVAQCMAFDGGTALPAPPRETVEALLGLRPGPAAWSTGKAKELRRHFRIAFTRPVALGTLCTGYDGAGKVFWFGANLDRTVSVLKPDAPYPGDVTKDEQWLTLSAGSVKTLPAGIVTRALRFTEVFNSPVATPSREYETPSSSFTPAMLIKERYYDALTLGTQKVLPQGRLIPDHWMGMWMAPQTLTAVVCLPMRDTTAVRIETLKPDTTEFPLFAPRERWKSQGTLAYLGKPGVLRFPVPLETKALHAVVEKGGVDFSYAVGRVLALVALKDTESPPTPGLPAAPFKLPYDMPLDGFVAVSVRDAATGKHVRRLVSETPRNKGAIREAWDLKDDFGQYVPPGNYTFSVLTRPPLKLTYENTVNNAGRPPWWAPVRGGGGWMADHSPPSAIGTVGDTMLMGSFVCESGQAGIATDLDGNKLWGESPVLGAWGGTYRIATDGRYGYLINHLGIERLDPQVPNFAPTEIHKFNFTVDVPGGLFGGDDLGGAAAKDDRLYISYHAPTIPWLISSPLEAQFDCKKSMPMVRKSHEYREYEYDDFARFYATFQVGTAPSSTAAYYGDAPANGALSNTLTVAFTKAIPIGCILVPDANVKVYALKPGLSLPSDEPDIDEIDPENGEEEDKFDEARWVPLKTVGRPGMPGIALLDKGFTTLALRYQAKRLAYSLIMNRRFADLAPAAERVFEEGSGTEKGGWKVTRPAKPPISEDNPARMALVWPTPVTLRGVSFHFPTTASMAIDTFIGPAGADPSAALADDSQWKQVGALQVAIFAGYWAQRATLRTVDFGDAITTRALRFRATLAADRLGPQGFVGPIKAPQSAGFDGIVAYSYLGNDPDGLPPALNERITEVKLPGATGRAEVLGHIPFAKPGHLAFDKKGTLYAIADGALVQVPLPLDPAKKPTEVLPKGTIAQPAGFAFGPDNLLYIADQGPRVVKVFDLAKTALVRTIGTPGGLRMGPWDASRFDIPDGVAVDKLGKVWVSEPSMQPKRISRWSPDGTLEKSFLGPTGYGQGGAYGGGGWQDPRDRSLIYYDGMKFTIDWATKAWKLAAILYRPGVNGPQRSAAPNRVAYIKGHRYLMGDPSVYHEIGVICTEKDGVARLLVAAGNLGLWRDVDRHEALKPLLKGLEREKVSFLWTDRNGDGEPQAAEMQISTACLLKAPYWPSHIGDDLTLNFDGVRLKPTSVRADGLPEYDLTKVEKVPWLTGPAWTTDDGRTFVLDNRLVDAAGKTLWRYPDDLQSVGGSKGVSYERPPGKLVGEFMPIGHFTIAGEEFFVTNANHGDWYVFTGDGMLAGCIFGGPVGYGRRHWTMPECVPGVTDVSDLRMDEEHFFGSVTRTEDGKVYALAGHNHLSLVRVDGFETIKRLNGTATVRKEDLDAAKTWEIARTAAERALAEPKVAKMPYVEDGGIAVDGSLDEWAAPLFMPIHTTLDQATMKDVVDQRVAVAFNDEHLYVAAEIADASPLVNTAANLTNLFKFGDAVDVCLGVNAEASATRTGPVPGDIRVLITQVGDKPVAEVFNFIVPDAPRDKRTRYFSDAGGEVFVDKVHEVDGAMILVTLGQRGYVLEAALPWKALGVPPPKVNSKIRADVGVLLGDENGLRTVERRYWAAKNQTVVADIPTEVRATPILWGELFVTDADPTVKFGPDAGNEP